MGNELFDVGNISFQFLKIQIQSIMLMKPSLCYTINYIFCLQDYQCKCCQHSWHPIPIDLHMEHINKIAKDAMRNLRSNKKFSSVSDWQGYRYSSSGSESV